MTENTFISCCSVENCASVQAELEGLRQQHERDQRVIAAAEKHLSMSADQIRLIAGECTAGEIRTVKAILGYIKTEFDKAKQ